jgi:hypothetical protein
VPKKVVMVRSREDNEMTTDEKIRGEGKHFEGYGSYSGHGVMSNQNIILLLSSGIFLGLTVFTKIPAITLIPLVGFIIFTNNNKSFKALALWIIPVVLIPLMWPTHAVLGGEFDKWQDGINYQITRASKPLIDVVNDFYKKDPVLLILGITGFVFVTVTRRDLIFLFWVIPFLVFFYAVDYVSHFHLIPLIPAFCIGAAVMIGDLSEKLLKNRKTIHRILPFVVISAIGIFGLVSTSTLIIKTRNSTDFEVVASAVQHLPENIETLTAAGNNRGIDTRSETLQSSDNKHITIIGTSKHFWILQYVFDRPEYDYKSPNNMISKKTLEGVEDGSERILMIADENMRKIVSGEELPRTSKAEIKAERLATVYDNSKVVENVHNVEIRTNY